MRHHIYNVRCPSTISRKLRPKNFDEIIGHDKIFSKTGSLKRIIKKSHCHLLYFGALQAVAKLQLLKLYLNNFVQKILSYLRFYLV